jgi:hypothetical protein
MINYIKYGFRWTTHPKTKDGIRKSTIEIAKNPKRFEIINFLLEQFKRETTYLEIGVRNPNHNFIKLMLIQSIALTLELNLKATQ